MKKNIILLLNIAIALLLLTACGNSLKTDKNTAIYLDGKTLSFAGADLIFRKDGTFTLNSPYPNDSTPIYIGNWSTSNYTKSGVDDAEYRNIDIYFSNFGQFTDGLEKGNPGVGRVLTGTLACNHSVSQPDYIRLKLAENEGMSTYTNGNFQSAQTEVKYDLK